jgi:hypothetical protein
MWIFASRFKEEEQKSANRSRLDGRSERIYIKKLNPLY